MKLKISTTLQKELQSLNRDKWRDSYTIENNNGVVIATKDKRLVHSKYSIENEARVSLKDVDEKTKTIIFYGFGLGVIVSHFIKNKKNSDIKIIVVVNDLYLFDYIYNNTDISIFENQNIFFVSDKDDSNFIFAILKSYNIFSFKYVMLQSLDKNEKEHAYNLHKELLSLLQISISDIFTRMNFENMWIKNILYNSLYIKSSADISIFQNALKGLNALLVSAGPTLENYIDTIKRERENFILIALDTSYNILCKNEIEVDFIITADTGFYNILDFVYDNKNFGYLVMDLITNKKIADITKNIADILTFSSTKSLSVVGDIEKKLNTKISELFLANTVATTMIDFSYFLGLSNVLLVGFDNSYPYYYRHVKHTLSYEYFINKTDRLNSIESYYFNAIKNTSDISNYPPTSYVLNNQIEYLNTITDKYKSMNIMRLSSDAINIENIKDGTIKDIVITGSRKKSLFKLKTLYKKNEIEKKDMILYYSDIHKNLTEFLNTLNKMYNELLEDKNDCDDLEKKLNKLIEEQVITKNILNTVINISNLKTTDIKTKLIFIITEAIKTSNYFNTRINIILEKLKNE